MHLLHERFGSWSVTFFWGSSVLLLGLGLLGCSIAECEQDADCGASQACQQGQCKAASAPPPRQPSAPSDTSNNLAPPQTPSTPPPPPRSAPPPSPDDVPEEGLAEDSPCNRKTKCHDNYQCIAATAQASFGACLRLVDSCDNNACGEGRICMALDGGGGTCFKACNTHDDCPHQQACTHIQNNGVVDQVCLPNE